MLRALSSREEALPPDYSWFVNADTETIWRFLEEGITSMMTTLQISHSRYMGLYTTSMNCFTSSKFGKDGDQETQRDALTLVRYERDR